MHEKEKAIKDKLESGICDFDTNITVLKLAERYISTKTGVKESKKAGYRTTLNIICNDPFGHKKIDQVKLFDAKLWLIKLQQKDGRRYSSIHNVRGIVRPAFQMAVDDNLLPKNPFDFHMSDVLYDDSEKRQALTPEQEAEFLRFIWQDGCYRKYYEVIYILQNTDMRISEFCGLIPEAVDFDNHCIHVTGQLVRHSNMLTAFETTKTEAGMRNIPMLPEVEDCFRAMEENRRDVPFEYEIDGHSGFYFLDKNGKPTVALHWEDYFQHIVAKYNEEHRESLPRITPHVCRHTFCSKMARLGINPKSLQYIMGHSEIAVTMDTYTHLQFEDAMADYLKVTGQEPEEKNSKRKSRG